MPTGFEQGAHFPHFLFLLQPLGMVGCVGRFDRPNATKEPNTPLAGLVEEGVARDGSTLGWDSEAHLSQRFVLFHLRIDDFLNTNRRDIRWRIALRTYLRDVAEHDEIGFVAKLFE